jgi:AAA+ superfamily predicted ATPase
MPTQRPTLPTGFSLPDAPAIEKALHTDDHIELYRLKSGPESTEILILQRGDPTASLAWWSSLTVSNMRLETIVGISDLPGFSTAAQLSAKGESLKPLSYTSSNPEFLESLFVGLIDCAMDGRTTCDLLPDLRSVFCWRTDDGKISSVVPLRASDLSESDAVRYVARSFFTIASGITLDETASSVPPLSQWCRGAGGKLSNIVGACLNSERGKRTIGSFAQLNSELGRQASSLLSGEWDGDRPRPVVSGHGSGLDKVAGMHELKALLRAEVVEPVRNPGPFQQYGLSIPNGILLYGPPGCGKTYIARALAEELGHHFLEIVPSELASPYVHGSVIRIRELFDEAAEQAPSVVFIDEFEALVPVRSGLGGFQHHKAEEVNEILTHLNGSSDKRVFIIAATNQPELIDPAVRRTGRLDKLIYVGPPDVEARYDMLLLHLSNRPLSDQLDVSDLAKQLLGYSASDLRFLVDEAARDALSKQTPISTESFQNAMRKITPSIPAELELQYQSIAQRGH